MACYIFLEFQSLLVLVTLFMSFGSVIRVLNYTEK